MRFKILLASVAAALAVSLAPTSSAFASDATDCKLSKFTTITFATSAAGYHNNPSAITTNCQFKIVVACNNGSGGQINIFSVWTTAKTTTAIATCPTGRSAIGSWVSNVRVV